MKRTLLFSSILGFLVFSSIHAPLYAYWIWSPSEGKFTQPEGITKRTAEEQYDYALQLHEGGAKYSEVVKVLKGLVDEYPQSVFAPRAQYMIAILHEENAEYSKAAKEFQKLIADFPRTAELDDAMERLFKIGNMYLTGEKERLLGVRVIPVYPKAVEIFSFIVDTAPYGSFGDQALLRLGLTYRKMGKLKEAVQSFEKLIENYPDSFLVDEAHYQLAETSYDFAQIADQDQTVRQEAVDHLDQYLKTYQSSALSERAKVLKRQLSEQDAEKKYRIARYYDKRGFTESATIYYEDVTLKYPNTTFGAQAKERLAQISEPLQVLQEKQVGRERRLAEVDSMLQALETEMETGGDQAKEQAFFGELQIEKEELLAAQEELQRKTQENFDERIRAFRDREKNLKNKFKTFQKKRDSLMNTRPTPELEFMFQRWEKSLLKEQKEVEALRSSLTSLGVEMKGKTAHVDIKRKKMTKKEKLKDTTESKLEKTSYSLETLIGLDQKAWDGLVRARTTAREDRTLLHAELEDLKVELTALEQKEFMIAQTLPQFDQLLPEGLRQMRESVMQERVAFEEKVQAFKGARDEFEAVFGEKVSVALVSEAPAETAAPKVSGDTAQTDAINGTGELSQMIEEKIFLLEKIGVQEQIVTSVNKALHKTESSAASSEETSVTIGLLGSEQFSEQQIRMLQKRMKFLEREIRKRLDQIEDWNSEKSLRMKRLETLVAKKRGIPGVKKLTHALLFPVKGFVKLGRSFLFGLEPNDDKLILKARQIVEEKPEGYLSDELAEIRLLQEEIEVQNLLVEGRSEEVRELESELQALQNKSKQIPGFQYESMLVPRFPNVIHQSVKDAKHFVSQIQGDTLIRQLQLAEAELAHLKTALTEVENRIAQIKQTATQPAQVSISVPGSTETLPSETESVALGLEASEMALHREELAQMKQTLDREANAFKMLQTRFETTLRDWYEVTVFDQLVPHFPEEERVIFAKQTEIGTEINMVRIKFEKAVRLEAQALQREEVFLNSRIEKLNQTMEKLTDLSSAERQVITDEIGRAERLRGFVLRDLSSLQTLIVS
jgi:outer membrane protein assembly factor BamD